MVHFERLFLIRLNDEQEKIKMKIICLKSIFPRKRRKMMKINNEKTNENFSLLIFVLCKRRKKNPTKE